MSKSEDKYPRISQLELENWMSLPTTKWFLQCLQWEYDHAKQDFVPVLDPTDADSSHAFLFERQGMLKAFEMMSSPLTILQRSGMYDEPTKSESADQ